MSERLWVWGLPLAPLSLAQAVEATVRLVRAGQPCYFITANTHYAMLTHQVPGLHAVNARAAFLLADGAPLVWASRWRRGTSLPERVAGSDLIYQVCERAAAEGLRIFLLGGEPGVADEAGKRLSTLYPGIRIVGTAAPAVGGLTPAEQEELFATVRTAQPDILFVAFGQPKGELWIAEHCESLGVPVSVQVGAAIDFVAGRVRRAPRGLRRVGMEWAHRMWLEPRRLAPRYARNALFMARMLAREFIGANRPGGQSAAQLAEVEP
ncbi:MAG: WecB/TagA/CpsF family glycosyltransferase [Isosphaeraceae bacterium]|nr:WecB/TagA/CpsF family glycosyltransferase [Isosphaeraceae bacterium]